MNWIGYILSIYFILICLLPCTSAHDMLCFTSHQEEEHQHHENEVPCHPFCVFHHTDMPTIQVLFLSLSPKIAIIHKINIQAPKQLIGILLAQLNWKPPKY